MTLKRENIHPETLARRVVGGRLLYSPVVTVENCRLVFVSGLLARDREANIVGRGDMGAQIRQVGENLKAALGLRTEWRWCEALPAEVASEVRS